MPQGTDQPIAGGESRAVTSDFVVPVPEGMVLRPYQIAGIEYCVKHQNVLLADEIGVGKTIQIIGLINALPSIQRVLIICPASLRLNWERELKKWLVRDYRITVLSSGRAWDYNADLEKPDQAKIVIINYDMLGNHHFFIERQEWDLLVCDEAHYMKNKNTARAMQVLGGGKGVYRPIPAKRKVFLTGTPIENRPSELWTLVHALRRDLFPDWWQYARRYCNARKTRSGGIDATGASNLHELRDILRNNFMIRRLKSEVLTELLPMVRQVIEIPTNGVSAIIAAENRAWENFERIKREIREALAKAEIAENPQQFREVVRNLREAERVAFGEIARRRHDTAVAKIPYVLAHLDDVGDSKVVIFAHHKDVINALVKKFGDRAVVLQGETSHIQRQKSVDRFQADPCVQFFIGSITAAGVGITLTASSHVVFAELDWVPGKISQSEGRLHRYTQLNSVLIQHLVFEGSLDARMAKTIVAKQEIIDHALDSDEAHWGNETEAVGRGVWGRWWSTLSPSHQAKDTAKPRLRKTPAEKVPRNIIGSFGDWVRYVREGAGR